MQVDYQRQRDYWNHLSDIDPDAAIIDPNDMRGFKNRYLAGMRDQAFLCALRTVSRQHPLLDFGCGTGSSTRNLIVQGFSVVGLDLAFGLLKHAQRRLDTDQALFVLYDGKNLPLAPSTFAAITIYGVLCYVTAEKGALQLLTALRGTMRDGAKIVMIEQVRRHRRMVESNLKVQRTLREIHRLLNDAGFKKVSSSILRHGRFPTTPIIKAGLLPPILWPAIASIEQVVAKMTGVFPWDYADVLFVAEA